MATSAYDRLEEKTTVGCEVTFDGTPIGVVEDEVSTLDETREYKNFLQRIQLYVQKTRQLGSERAYRWCYWTVGERDTVPFGQYALLLSEPQLRDMLAQARNKGWPI